MFCVEPSLNSEWYINSLLDRCHDNKSFQNLHQEQLSLYLFKYGSYAEMLCSNEDYKYCSWNIGNLDELLLIFGINSHYHEMSGIDDAGELSASSLWRDMTKSLKISGTCTTPQCAYSLSTWCQDFPGFSPSVFACGKRAKTSEDQQVRLQPEIPSLLTKSLDW